MLLVEVDGLKAPFVRCLLEEWRNPRGSARLDDAVDADGVEGFEWTELPGESPAHRPIDVVYGVCDGRRDLGRVEQVRRERGAQEAPDFVVAAEQRSNPFTDVVDRSGRVDGRKLRRLGVSERQRCRIERENPAGRIFLVETLAGLHSGHAPFDQRFNERRQREFLSRLV